MMGVPISKIILASNSNNILTDFVKTGDYDIRYRNLIKTSSPAMDILKSSNIERLLYHLYGGKRTKGLMDLFESDKYFKLSKQELNKIQDIFEAGFATDDEVESYIKYSYLDDNYVIDPHTATAFVVKTNLKIDGNVIIASTAEWTKFTPTIAKAFGKEDNLKDLSDFLNSKLSPHISKLENMPVIHTDVIEIDEIQGRVLDFV